MKTPQGNMNRYRRNDPAHPVRSYWWVYVLLGACVGVFLAHAALATAVALPEVIAQAEARQGW